MFTGIIEEMGSIAAIQKGSKSFRITLNCRKVLADAKMGDSIAVNGVCLTVSGLTGSSFSADVMAETVRRSALGDLKVGSRVNLERAMLAGGRFGGHIVSGHIDGTGRIREFKKEDNAVWVTIETEPKLLRYIVEKGSIAIDGISLTVADLSQDAFKVSVIPHTRAETTLLLKNAGDRVNLENDIIGKYVERLLYNSSGEEGSRTEGIGKVSRSGRSGVTMDLLMKNGFL